MADYCKYGEFVGWTKKRTTGTEGLGWLMKICRVDISVNVTKTVTKHGGVALGLAMAVVINGCRVGCTAGEKWTKNKQSESYLVTSANTTKLFEGNLAWLRRITFTERANSGNKGIGINPGSGIIRG